eukprot:1640149-Pyramimonas_sp.AAC.1
MLQILLVGAGSFQSPQLNIWPADDPVPRVDNQAGMNKPIQCNMLLGSCQCIHQTLAPPICVR